MIKCYLVTSLVDNDDVQTRGGKFTKRRDYIAKVSNKKDHTVEVLDERFHWVPFNSIQGYGGFLSFSRKFDVQKVFFAKNKKSMRELFGTEGSISYRYSKALQFVYDQLHDYRFYRPIGISENENTFVI